jgi:sec-independent protein translocase protein TatC
VPRRASHDYPDDIFDTSRMSFGDHIEELRSRLIKALYGLGFCLFIGFILDYAGDQIGLPNLGIGRPMMKVITEPAEAQVRAFYERRNERARVRLITEKPDQTELERVQAKYEKADRDLSQLTEDEKRTLRGAPQPLPVRIPVAAFEKAFGLKAADPDQTHLDVTIETYPQHLHYLNIKGEGLLMNRQYMKTQSAQEAFMVYFKVSLLCGVILGSPVIFYQLWAFIAAGLYPHEKRYVHLYLPISVGLFLAGALLCQFVVLPGAVKALIAFNDWIDLDPDLRMNEWLGFAIILPIVFGASFQTPLVMFFLSRTRLLTYDVFLSYWRTAIFVLAVFAAVITPTPDVVTMMYLFVPMFGLYLIGVLVCYWFPPAKWDDEDDAEAQVAV